jgi:hypothetical protein
MDVIAKKAAAAPFYGNSECARCSASLSKGCYWVPNNEISKVAICEACYRKEKATEIPDPNIPEDLQQLYFYASMPGESENDWRCEIPKLIERIASQAETIRLSKAAYETNLATAEHNKRVSVNELNAEIRALTEECGKHMITLASIGRECREATAEDSTADEAELQEILCRIADAVNGMSFELSVLTRTQEGDATK